MDNNVASTEHVFVKHEPMREELVQMAVKFLSHSTVRNSPVIHRRTFLEQKGLTRKEIDEAFCHVSDPPSNVTTGQSLTSHQDAQSNAFTNVQPQATALATSLSSQFYWTHALVVVGFLAASFVGTTILLKNSILPRLKSWIWKIVLEEHDGSIKKSNPCLIEEVTAAAKSATSAAADGVKTSMKMLNSKNKDRHYLETLVKRLDIQVAEMRTISNVIKKLEGTREAALSLYKKPEKYNQRTSGNGPNNIPQNRFVLDSKENLSSLGSLTNVKANDTSSFDGSVRPSSAPPSMGQHPRSYMEIMAMVQRGETPPGIKEINDSPPNPDQPLPNPRVVPRIKPWEVAQSNNNGSYAQNLGSTLQLSGDRMVPWWHRKNIGVTEPTNGKRTNFYHVMTHEQPVNTSWAPPQPPSFAMAGEASAIRYS
ncbi:Peroxisomal membrane protein PEX14 [Melia azedarach]|uniref:Peroxisomal membrane protein PEX14 n=1 Tax=Melia azedarach TaxID=155640 RepID=A0ACC1XIJ2_MELAZ|nr:Peroxisomal membrane protein PEX14 [Melia azedarach]